jgi:hypothetical protein
LSSLGGFVYVDRNSESFSGGETLKVRHFIFALAALSFAACHRGNYPSAHGLRAAVLEEEDCSVGELLTFQEYDEREHALANARKKKDGIVDALDEINDWVEPEATYDLLQVLTSSKTRVFYGDYDPETVVGLDGLAGLRVIRQRVCESSEGKRLLSFISTYFWDSVLRKFLPHTGADRARLRMQLEEFVSGGHANHSKGVAAFSWFSEGGASKRISKVRGESYLDDDDNFRYPVDVCSLHGHCSGCHHGTHLNTFSEHYITQPLTQMRGYRQFVKEMKAKPGMSPEEISQIETAMKSMASFDTTDLQTALRERWKGIGKEVLEDHGVTGVLPIP